MNISLPLHVSLSFAWDNDWTYQGTENILKIHSKGQTFPLNFHVLQMLSPGDAIDIQVATRDPCSVELRSKYLIEVLLS